MPLPFNLKKQDASRLLEFSKGIAILLIFLHHFARTIFYSRGEILPAVQQWNFDATGQGFGQLAAAVREGRFSDLWLQLFAQYGYVGVHLFVLLSGLGLALGTGYSQKFGVFMKRRIRKIVPPFWTAVAFFAVMAAAVGQPYTIRFLFERLFLLTTFDQRNFFGFDTPLWCLAVFFQLYLLFLPVRWLIDRYGPRVILAMAAVSFIARWAMSAPAVLSWNAYFGHVFGLNWLGIFGLGVWIGCKIRREDEVSLPMRAVGGMALAAGILLALSERFAAFYPIHDTAVGIVTGAALLLAWSALSRTHTATAFALVGSVSFPLFLYHRPLLSLAIYLWHNGYLWSAMPPFMLCIFLVPTAVSVAVLMRQVLLLRPNIANMAFGESLERFGLRSRALALQQSGD